MYLKLLGTLVALVQLADITLHVVIDQVELLRIAASIVILLWLVMLMYNRFNFRLTLTTIGAISTYVTLNILFLILNGLTSQAGEARVLLYVFVLFTVVASTFVSILYNRSQ